MPDIVGLPRNWDILIEYLRQRRYTSGDVEACIGVSRKVLKDWDGAGILDQLYQGLGSGRGRRTLRQMAALLYFRHLEPRLL
jgi:hypothetical protein